MNRWAIRAGRRRSRLLVVERRQGALIPAILALAMAFAAPPDVASAHPLDPALLELTEAGDGIVDVLWRLPASRPRDAPLEPVLPERCAQLAPAQVHQGSQRVTVRWRLACGPGSLVGERVGVEGLHRRQTDALLRVHLADGRLIQTVLRGEEPSFRVPARTRPSKVFLGYLGLGFEHILTGLDHLLFVLGLVLLVRGRHPSPRRGASAMLWTITAFTAGHSLTLSLAVLGFLSVSPAAVEVLIAGSIFAVAVELTREAETREATTARWTWALALAFGLLHGLGFAGALARIGLPAGEIPLALFSFNLGIELGQLLFVAVLLLAAAALRRLPAVRPLASATARVPAYAIGTLAAFWIFERLAVLFEG